MSQQDDLVVRHATEADADAVVDFSKRIWTDRGGDYIQYVYHDWIESDGDDQRTFVVDAGDDIAGIVQAVMLSEHEAWFQGMRVNPDFRNRGVADRLNDASFEWAAEHGATVGRIMVFSWNAPGLGAARAAGFEPATEFRWAEPDPDPDALDRLHTDPSVSDHSVSDHSVSDHSVTENPDAAWSNWRQSEAFAVLGGLALDRSETWAVSELTRQDLRDAAADTCVLTVETDRRTAAMAFRVRDYERENDDGETKHWAEYGLATWDDIDAARTLFAAIAEDAAALGADETRALIPETPRYVSDASWARVGISDEPDFVLERDLTDYL